jgi:malate dehydrogenase
MVPVPSQVKVGGKPLDEVLSTEQIDAIVERTRAGGSEIVALLKTGSAYFAPSAAAAQMVKAVINDTGEIMPVCAWTTGEYGVSDVYLGVPAKLGANGVEKIIELPLTPSEMEAVREASLAVKAKIDDLHSIVL